MTSKASLPTTHDGFGVSGDCQHSQCHLLRLLHAVGGPGHYFDLRSMLSAQELLWTVHILIGRGIVWVEVSLHLATCLDLLRGCTGTGSAPDWVCALPVTGSTLLEAKAKAKKKNKKAKSFRGWSSIACFKHLSLEVKLILATAMNNLIEVANANAG